MNGKILSDAELLRGIFFKQPSCLVEEAVLFIRWACLGYKAVHQSAKGGYLTLQDACAHNAVSWKQHEFITEGVNVYQMLSLQIEVQNSAAKYAVLYVANESPSDVFFDDLSLKHERLVWQENSYYPFGLAIKPLDKEGKPNDRFQFMGIEKEDVLGLDWAMTEFRPYDSQLGRFHQVDKLAEMFVPLTPYHYSYNNPTMFNDPTGLAPQYTYNWDTGEYEDKEGLMWLVGM